MGQGGRRLADQLEQNKENVTRLFEALAAREADRQVALTNDSVISHGPAGTQTLESEEYVAFLEAQLPAAAGELVLDVFGERDTVFAIFNASSAEQHVAGVIAFRLEEEKVSEAWTAGPVGAVWDWKPSPTKGDSEETRGVLHRWYDEMYGQGRYLDLAPILCGPKFVRHEAQGTFEATAEEHGQRLHTGTKGQPYVVGKWQAFAEGDKVGVIGTEPRGFTQAWRVAGCKLVESWWPKFADGPWS